MSRGGLPRDRGGRRRGIQQWGVGVPVTDSDEQVKTVPWAAQWHSCSRTATTDCKAHEYTVGWWVDREVRERGAMGQIWDVCFCVCVGWGGGETCIQL